MPNPTPTPDLSKEAYSLDAIVRSSCSPAELVALDALQAAVASLSPAEGDSSAPACDARRQLETVTLIRFLRGYDMNVAAAEKAFRESLVWRRDFRLAERLSAWRSGQGDDINAPCVTQAAAIATATAAAAAASAATSSAAKTSGGSKWWPFSGGNAEKAAGADTTTPSSSEVPEPLTSLDVLRDYGWLRTCGTDKRGVGINLHLIGQGDPGGIHREIGGDALLLYFVDLTERLIDSTRRCVRCASSFVFSLVLSCEFSPLPPPPLPLSP